MLTIIIAYVVVFVIVIVFVFGLHVFLYLNTRVYAFWVNELGFDRVNLIAMMNAPRRSYN